jgi:hypothetical protein
MIFVQFNTVLLEGNVAVVVVAVANMTKVLLGSSLVTEEPRYSKVGRRRRRRTVFTCKMYVCTLSVIV